MSRTKPEETLVEVGSGFDVQINRLNCVLGLKTNRTVLLLFFAEISLRIAGAANQFYQVKRLIRGIRVEMILTYSQTLNAGANLKNRV